MTGFTGDRPLDQARPTDPPDIGAICQYLGLGPATCPAPSACRASRARARRGGGAGGPYGGFLGKPVRSALHALQSDLRPRAEGQLLRPGPADRRAVPAGRGVARRPAGPAASAGAARCSINSTTLASRAEASARRGDDGRLHETCVRHADVEQDARRLRPVRRAGRGPRALTAEPDGVVPADGPAAGRGRRAVRQRAPGDLRPLRPLLRHAREQLRHAEGLQPPAARPGLPGAARGPRRPGAARRRRWSS